MKLVLENNTRRAKARDSMERKVLMIRIKYTELAGNGLGGQSPPT